MNSVPATTPSDKIIGAVADILVRAGHEPGEAVSLARQGYASAMASEPHTDAPQTVTKSSALRALDFLEQSNSDGRKAEAAQMLSAAGSESSAYGLHLLRTLLASDVGRATLQKLEQGQGTHTADGRAWLAAKAFLHSCES